MTTDISPLISEDFHIYGNNYIHYNKEPCPIGWIRYNDRLKVYDSIDGLLKNYIIFPDIFNNFE